MDRNPKNGTGDAPTTCPFAEARLQAAKRLQSAALDGRLPALGASLEGPWISFPYFHRRAMVHRQEERCLVDDRPAPGADEVLLLHYLVDECSAAPTGTWISFREVPDSAPYFAAYHQRGPARMARFFGDDEARFCRAAQALGGVRKQDLPGVAWTLHALPTMPLAVILHPGEPGLPADAQLLFDRSILSMWCAEDIAVLGELAAFYLERAG